MTLTASPPPLVESGRLRRLASPLAAGAVAALGTVALHVRDPHASGSWGYCPTALLGFSCPFCGSLRAVNDLTHLDLAAAASSNLLIVVAAPVVVAFWTRRVAACWRGEPRRSRCGCRGRCGSPSSCCWASSRSPGTCPSGPGSPPEPLRTPSPNG